MLCHLAPIRSREAPQPLAAPVRQCPTLSAFCSLYWQWLRRLVSEARMDNSLLLLSWDGTEAKLSTACAKVVSFCAIYDGKTAQCRCANVDGKWSPMECNGNKLPAIRLTTSRSQAGPWRSRLLQCKWSGPEGALLLATSFMLGAAQGIRRLEIRAGIAEFGVYVSWLVAYGAILLRAKAQGDDDKLRPTIWVQAAWFSKSTT